jgi:GT2 family glycosyltransferase/glycosyltransferase involved in cell wall biosynthesis
LRVSLKPGGKPRSMAETYPVSSPSPGLSKTLKPKPRPRVLLVAHNLEMAAQAGTESYCLSLGQALADLEVRVTFLAPQGPRIQSRQDEISWRQGELSGLPFLSFTRMNPDIQGSVEHPGFEEAFQDILQSHPVDLVHFHHTYLSSVSLLKSAQKAGLPVILTLHDAWLLCPRLHLMTDQGLCSGPESPEKCAACLEPFASPAAQRNLARFLERRLKLVQKLLPGCRILSPSRFLRNLHYDYGLARGEIIHLPLGLKEIGPIPQEPTAFPPKFVFLGNIIPVKRLDLAIAAFAPLAGQALLEIRGQLPSHLENQFLESIAPYPHISYCGPYPREDLPKILAGVTATLITSDFENYPLVVRESLMLKVPIIGSKAGGIPEIIEHGKNGLLFRPGDAEALHQQVARLVKRPQLVERLRRHIKPVKSMRQEAEELLDLYRSMIARRRGAQPDDKAVWRNPARAAAPPVPPAAGGACAVSKHTPSGRCSIIIPVVNNLELTQACLKSIKENTAPGSYEIIAVDNGSTDGTRDFLQRNEYARVLKPILNETNLGFARASNQGARAAQGDFLVFLNNDTQVTPGWLTELAAAAARSSRTAAVGAKLLYPDDTVQHAGVVFNSEKKVFHIYKHFHRDHPAVNKERSFQSLTAACLLVKRDVFFEVGLFDERFINGFEDVDLCLKMGSKGLALLYNPRSVVFHLESKTPGRHAKERENAELLAARWLPRILPDAEAYYAADGIIVHYIRQANGELTAVMFDRNANPFWEEAARLKAAGEPEAACEQYLHALLFNPYDSRKWTIGAELADLLERLGRPQDAAFHRACLAQLLPAVYLTPSTPRPQKVLENSDNLLAGYSS